MNKLNHRPKMKSLLIRWATLLIASLSLVSGVLAQPVEDIYDRLFSDDTLETTQNYIESGVPQQHTLDTPDDADWFIFPTPVNSANYQFMVTVPPGTSMIDPAITVVSIDGETTFSQDCFLGDPGEANCNLSGENESVSITLPAGIYAIRVRHAGTIHGDDASYTITINAQVGDSAGLGTIFSASVGPEGGSIPGSAGRETGDTKQLATEPIYPERRITFAGNAGGATPSLSRTQLVTFGHTRDAYDPVKSRFTPAGAWQQRPETAQNFTVVVIQLSDSFQFEPGLVSFGTPATLYLQLVNDKILNSQIPVVDDVPEGYSPNHARVMIWNPTQNEWEEFDPSPTYEGNGIFSTQIDSIESYLTPGTNEVYFGLEALPTNSATEWTFYR